MWVKDSDKFNSPFSLDVQQEWYERYKVRVWFYESTRFNPNGSKFALRSRIDR